MPHQKPNLPTKIKAIMLACMATIAMLLPILAIIGIIIAGAGALKRFTDPDAYWAERVHDAGQKLKSSMRDYDTCMNNFERNKRLAELTVSKMITDGHPPEQSRKIAQDDIAKLESNCMFLEKNMKAAYENMKYIYQTKSSQAN